MATTKILFNTTDKIKEKAKKRAKREGTDLTAVLNQAMFLYAEGTFDPDDFLSKEDMRAIRRAQAEIADGKFYTLEQVRNHLKARVRRSV